MLTSCQGSRPVPRVVINIPQPRAGGQSIYLVCCRLDVIVPYGGGSEGKSPASKSLIACSFSSRALEIRVPTPRIGVLNRGTPSPPRIPRPCVCAVSGKSGGIFRGHGKNSGKQKRNPTCLCRACYKCCGPRSPRPMNVRDGLDRDGPAAEDEDRSPGTGARAQAPARLNNERSR
jgi:hypothetical protein